jgi:transposase InsO family protein
MTPQNYYARRCARNRREVDADLVLVLVQAERRFQPRLGTRKLYHLIRPELEAAGVKMGRDRLFVILSEKGLLVSPKPSEWPRTTRVDANLPVFKNLAKSFKLSGPNQVWASDITYIRTEQAFLYLALITDSWSRKIVGYHLGQTLETHNALKALAMALKGLSAGQHPIHHSESLLPVRLAPVCPNGAKGGVVDEYDGEKPQCRKRACRAGQRDTQTGILAGPGIC